MQQQNFMLATVRASTRLSGQTHRPRTEPEVSRRGPPAPPHTLQAASWPHRRPPMRVPHHPPGSPEGLSPRCPQGAQLGSARCRPSPPPAPPSRKRHALQSLSQGVSGGTKSRCARTGCSAGFRCGSLRWERGRAEKEPCFLRAHTGEGRWACIPPSTHQPFAERPQLLISVLLVILFPRLCILIRVCLPK